VTHLIDADSLHTIGRNMKPIRAYKRDLPGMGFVVIDISPVRSVFRGRTYEGKVLVERRVGGRGTGQLPDVIAEASGKSVEAVVQQLFPTAQYNPAIAAGLCRNEPSHRG
jgi:hypothetical protein